MQSIFGDMDDAPTKINDITALSNWDVSNVTNMSFMFFGCDASDLSALSNWDVGRVTDMSYMFSSCYKLIDASGINDWNIINVNNFTSMFSGCSVHPEFTKVTGTWDNSGTFTPTP